MKKRTLVSLSSFFFLIVLTAISFRYFSVLAYQSLYKQEFRLNALVSASAEIESITLQDVYKNEDNVQWKDNFRELTINGKYYEVVAIRPACGAFKIFLIEDKAESILFTNFLQERQDPLSRLFSLLSSFLFVIPDTQLLAIPALLIILNSSLFLHISNPCLPVAFRPPAFLSSLD